MADRDWLVSVYSSGNNRDALLQERTASESSLAAAVSSCLADSRRSRSTCECGAGAAGGGPLNSSSGGYGGHGVQLPATFTSPFVNVGHTGHAPGNHYVAGGGGGGGSPGGSGGSGGLYDGSAANGPGPWNAGAGRGGNGTEPHATINSDGYMDAKASTGSGGGGNYTSGRSGSGGSGVVLIAYPT